MADLRDLGAIMREHFGDAWSTSAALGEPAVAAFEKAHGITLPEPYRNFVANVANGAKGPPAYGIVQLGDPEGEAHGVQPGMLVRPFPLAKAWHWDAEGLDPDADPRIRDVLQHGSLVLGTDGCAMDYVLIVTGAARGQVWLLTGEFALPVARDFGAWIARDLLPDAAWTIERKG